MPACSSQRAPRRGDQGYNLVELLMSLSMATIIFMAIVVIFIKQSEMIQGQNDGIDVGREAQFALDHLRRDLTALGSNSTPNSDVDPQVCPKPTTSLRAFAASIDNGFVVRPDLNTNVRPLAMTLFGSLDVKQRFRTASISGATVVLLDDGKLPANQAAFEDMFATDRYLRISGSDGTQMFFVIASSSFNDRSVALTEAVPRQGEGQVCGYQAFGENYNVDVQNFVRYRVIADNRPGAPTDKIGQPTQTLLVRERMGTDGTTLRSQLVLAENAVDLTIYDVLTDEDPTADRVAVGQYVIVDDVVQAGGAGVLGTTPAARPEALRALTIKLSLRSPWPDPKRTPLPRDDPYKPLVTYRLGEDELGSHPVYSVATRITMPTLVSRNL